ncbi:hypothetical protein QUF79_24635 [Fictibacillus enclensis]|uniref:hypothetical protein n=1 Tax=Fictibacillus enclensis TaxID=1017270 RepID=UPI0025A051E4|nr:hypothetical protein [Fictibacillus enclensis]MDM5201217.1 hypothetical protein [Fictibacillus enclensis]
MAHPIVFSIIGGGSDLPVLSETPPGNSLQELYTLHEELTVKKKKIQAAEQYEARPLKWPGCCLFQYSF